MGGTLTAEQRSHARELHELVKRLSGDKQVTRKDIKSLVAETSCQCPWYPERGTLSAEEWEKIGNHLKAEPRAAAPHLIAWQVVNSAVGRLSQSTAPKSCPQPAAPLAPPGDPPGYPVPVDAPPLSPARPRLGAVEAGIAEAKKRGECQWDDGIAWEPNNHPAMFPVTITREGDNINYAWEPLPFAINAAVGSSTAPKSCHSVTAPPVPLVNPPGDPPD